MLPGSPELECTDRRVTLLTTAALPPDGAHRYELPLPAELGAMRALRRIVLTLAWRPQIQSRRARYRGVKMWAEIPDEFASKIRVERSPAWNRDARRGTLQHEVYEGTDVFVVETGRALPIQVNCMGDALKESAVPSTYALAVTFEIAEEIDVDLYARIRDHVRVGLRPARV